MIKLFLIGAVTVNLFSMTYLELMAEVKNKEIQEINILKDKVVELTDLMKINQDGISTLQDNVNNLIYRVDALEKNSNNLGSVVSNKDMGTELAFKNIEPSKPIVTQEIKNKDENQVVLKDSRMNNEYFVLAKSLFLRSSPNSDSRKNVINVLKNGDVVFLEKGHMNEHGWVLVRTDNHIGYIYNKYISKK
jgi:hypothetical protein